VSYLSTKHGPYLPKKKDKIYHFTDLAITYIKAQKVFAK